TNQASTSAPPPDLWSCESATLTISVRLAAPLAAANGNPKELCHRLRRVGVPGRRREAMGGHVLSAQGERVLMQIAAGIPGREQHHRRCKKRTVEIHIEIQPIARYGARLQISIRRRRPRHIAVLE